MSGPPSLYAMVMMSELRRAEFIADGDRDRLGRLAQGEDRRRLQLADFPAVMVAVALLVVVGVAAAL